MLSARALYDTAPLGALVRYSSTMPQPPAADPDRFASWRRENGLARLAGKLAGQGGAGPGFTLQHTLVGAEATLVINTTHFVTSPLCFEVVELPSPGAVLCLRPAEDGLQLKFLAADRSEAAVWGVRHGYSDDVYREVRPGGRHIVVGWAALARPATVLERMKGWLRATRRIWRGGRSHSDVDRGEGRHP